MSGTDVADTLSWLDAEFVQTVLRDAEVDAALVVTRLEVERGVLKGDNYASTLLRVSTEFRRGEQKSDTPAEVRSLMVKALPLGQMMLNMVKTGKLFDKEGHMYRVTLPAMYDIMSEKLPNDPLKVFSSRSYRTSRPDTIILEDLKPLGYKMVDRRKLLDLDHCKVAVKTLGLFHGVSRALLVRDPASLDEYVDTLFTEENRPMFESVMSASTDAHASVIESWTGFERFGDKIRKFGETSFGKMIDIVKPKPGKFSVLTHGDCWVNNMLFKYSETTGKVEDIRFVDFQLSRFASPALDLLYFFYSSVGTEVRERDMDVLLEEYHVSLCDTLEFLGLDRDVFTMADLKQAMEENSFLGFYTASSLLCLVVAEPADLLDVDTLTEDDLLHREDNPMVNALNSKSFREIYEKVLLHFEPLSIF